MPQHVPESRIIWGSSIPFKLTQPQGHETSSKIIQTMTASHLLGLAALLTGWWWVYHNVWLFVRKADPP